MRRIAPVLVLLGLAPVAWAASRESDTVRAERYLREVRSHLAESYIFHDRVDLEAVDRAVAEGLISGIGRRSVGNLTAEQQELLRGIVREFGSAPAEALRAAAIGAEELGARIDLMALADFAANAMIRTAGDRYGRVLTMNDLQRLMRMLQGERDPNQLGLSIHSDGNALRVEFTMFGYAAYEAGVRIGDRITHIGGRAVGDLAPDDIAPSLSLEGRDEIRLTIERPGYREPFDLAVRRVEPPQEVLSTMLDGGIGYIRLTIFDMRSARAMREALERLNREGMRALVLDLRFNPGGDLRAAQAICDEFIGAGHTIARTEFSYRPLGGLQIPGLTPPERLVSRGGGRFEELPLVVLVNHASASASELTAGALQRIGRARLVGTNTFGKGVGQSIIPIGGFGPGSRFLYLTVMQYFVGGDTPVGEEGIAPDVVVEEPAPSEGEFRALLRLRASGAARTYAERLVEQDRQQAQRLAESEEGMRADAYPGIGDVAAGVPLEAVRAEVRRELRRLLWGERAVCDPYADAVLARAVGMLRRPAEPASESPFHADRLRRVVEFLASPEMRGRGLGTEENARAARWIGERFDALGLDTVVNGHRFHEFDVRGRTLRNVAGILRGPAGARGYVVVAAHHDGLGVRGDEVRPGADDNASGVAAMLAVAEALRADRGALRRHVVFVSFDGEESGLIGSMRFVADGVVPAGQIAFFLVFDVVGGEFLPGDGRIYAMGGEYSAQVGEWVGRCAQRADAPVTPVGTYVIEPFGPLTARSDYLAFRDARVPYLFVSTGTPWYYHTRYDSPERLNYGKISAVARFAYEVVREAATSEVQAEFRTDPPAQVSDARVVLDGVEKVLDGSAGIRPARELREALEEDRAALRAIVERGEVDAAGRRAIQRAMANVFRAVAAYRPEE